MLRRNGKPRSCEPCRISKIKCDHATPTCQKCRTRGITEQCFYHPNPMTKPAGTPRKKPEPRRRKFGGSSLSGRNGSLDNHGRLSSLTLSPPSLRHDIGTTVPTHSSWPTPPDSATQATRTPSDPARSFYLGSTSYASVFTQDQPLPETVHEQPSERSSATPSLSSRYGGNRHCQTGIGHAIVAMLTPFSFFEKSIHMYFNTQKASPLAGPILERALPQLRIDVEELVNSENSVHRYAEMTKNSARPLKVPPNMLATEFHHLFTGKNLRWETLGLVLAVASSNAQFTAPGDPVFTLEDGKKLEKDALIEDIIHATDACIHICEIHGAVNDIMVWLVYTHMMVISNFYGDNHHGTWRRMGDSVSALYAAGLHCEGEFSQGVNGEPLFLRESRRRLYSSVYRSDKTLAIFFGRPCMMGWRYSDRRQPLDVSDVAIMSDDPELLNRELAVLDSTGWNTEGKIHPSSFLRVRCQHALIKERLLEQSLAGEKDTDIVQNLQSISVECTAWWNTIPAHLRYETYTEEACWIGLGAGLTVRLISLYLDYLHVHFQIQRLLHRQTQDALPALLELSLKLLSTSLVSVKPNNRVYETRRHFPTVILFYCFPAAGVLALELRRCTIEGVPLPSTVSRADVIRNLSVLTSCLEWIVLPGDGNHKLCSELNKMLALLLDEVLNYEAPVPSENTEDIPNPSQGIFDMPMIDGLEPVPTEAEDFLNWLENATWNPNV